jgi:hypothetical protein
MMPFLLFYHFSKNPDNCVETDRTSKRFFGRKLDLARSKDNGLRGVRHYCSFKAPSTYASAAMVRRLASTARVLRSSFDLFSKVFGRPPGLWSRSDFENKTTPSYLSNLSSSQGQRTSGNPYQFEKVEPSVSYASVAPE